MLCKQRVTSESNQLLYIHLGSAVIFSVTMRPPGGPFAAPAFVAEHPAFLMDTATLSRTPRAGMAVGDMSYKLGDWLIAPAVARGAVECLMTGPISSLSETGNSSYGLLLLAGLPRFGST